MSIVKPHDCYNRERPKDVVLAQTGWVETSSGFSRIPVMRNINDRMTKDCKYSIHYGTDPKCAGCKWNQLEGRNGE